MSRYVVRIVGPAGWERYLARGHEVATPEQATRYPHPSNAWHAAEAFQQQKRGVITDVVDTRDAENQVPQG